MTKRNCMQMLKKKYEEQKHACIGLDIRLEEISKEIEDSLREKADLPSFGSTGPLMREFNKAIIERTKDIVCAYKLNLGFYLAESLQGVYVLRETVEFSHTAAPGVIVILDGKSGDVGLSAAQYAKFAFEQIGVDAVTVNPWGGLADGIDAFLEYENKGIFVWCRGSNEGAGEFQDLYVATPADSGLPIATPLYQYTAYRVANFWNDNNNCGLVVGATYPEELKQVRELTGGMPMLIPGIGKQGGDLEKTVKAALYTDPETGNKTFPAIINSSRGIIYASSGEDFAEVARKKTLELNRQIRKILKEEGAHND